MSSFWIPDIELVLGARVYVDVSTVKLSTDVGFLKGVHYLVPWFNIYVSMIETREHYI